MLVYIRTSEFENVMQPIDVTKIPSFIKTIVDQQDSQDQISSTIRINAGCLRSLVGQEGIGSILGRVTANNIEIEEFYSRIDKLPILNFESNKNMLVSQFASQFSNGLKLPKESFFMWYYDEKTQKLAPLLTEVIMKEDVTLGLIFFDNKATPLVFIDTLEDLGPLSKLVVTKKSIQCWNPIPENVDIPSNPDLYQELVNVDFKLVLLKKFEYIDGKGHLVFKGISFKDIEHECDEFFEDLYLEYPNLSTKEVVYEKGINIYPLKRGEPKGFMGTSNILIFYEKAHEENLFEFFNEASDQVKVSLFDSVN